MLTIEQIKREIEIVDAYIAATQKTRKSLYDDLHEAYKIYNAELIKNGLTYKQMLDHDNGNGMHDTIIM